jgi:protein tyrosine/serine phosphatase
MKRIDRTREIASSRQSSFLVPPNGYGIVTESISRCGTISPRHLPFLSLYQFKTFLFVSEDNPHQTVTQFLRDENIRCVRIGIPWGRGNIPWRTQLDEVVKRTLEFILDRDNSPVLMSSSSTLHLCTIVGSLRRMQGWNLCSIMEEFRRFTPEHPISMYKNYVEMFDFDLINVPENSTLYGER